jgi:hypothetical protein
MLMMKVVEGEGIQEEQERRDGGMMEEERIRGRVRRTISLTVNTLEADTLLGRRLLS